MPDGFHQEDIKIGWFWNRLNENPIIKVNVKIIEISIFKNLATNREK